MPELPEVETTLRGIEPHLLNQRVARVIVRDPRLRWPVPADVSTAEGQLFVSLQRRGKYLLLKQPKGFRFNAQEMLMMLLELFYI